MSSPRASLQLQLILVGVSILFSFNYLLGKIALAAFHPTVFTALRIAGAAIVLTLIPMKRMRTRPRPFVLIGLAILGIVVNQFLFVTGLSMTTAHEAAILITTIPVFTLLSALAARREQPGLRKFLGIAAAAAGALSIVGVSAAGPAHGSLAGNILILCNCLAYGLYLMLSRDVVASTGPQALVRAFFQISAPIALLIAAPRLMQTDLTAVPAWGWAALAGVIIGPTAAAYSFSAWALEHAESSVVASYSYIQPVSASLLALLFLGERITLQVLISAIVILFGVWLASHSSSGKSVPATPAT